MMLRIAALIGPLDLDGGVMDTERLQFLTRLALDRQGSGRPNIRDDDVHGVHDEVAIERPRMLIVQVGDVRHRHQARTHGLHIEPGGISA